MELFGYYLDEVIFINILVACVNFGEVLFAR